MKQYLFRNSWWSKRDRPKIKIGLTLFDLIIEVAGVVALLALWIVVLATYSGLPEMIPTHYDVSGQADHFGKRSGIFLLPVIATITFAAIIIMCRFPHLFNYPVRITKNNALFQYRNSARMARCMALAVVFILGFIVLHAILNTGDHISIWFLVVLLVIIFIPMIYFLVMSFKNR